MLVAMSYLPVPRGLPLDPLDSDSREFEDEKTVRVLENWHGGPQTLRKGLLIHILSIIWDVGLTLGPIYFIVLAILACPLDGQAISTRGERLRNLNLVSPTIYPILFAAIASRFYKNLARWRLETRNGIRLATLEQIFGSQSLAGCIERLVFARTHLALGLLILLTWGLSPLGGQSAARLLTVQIKKTGASGTVSYVHPSYQVSWFVGGSGIDDVGAFTNALYVSCLLSAQNQMDQPRDLWGLPKIPQLPSNSEEDVVYEVDSDALSAGNTHYASLLGQKVQGLNFIDGNSSYTFATESSYLDFECKLVNANISFNASSDYFTEAELNITLIRPELYRGDLSTFVASMQLMDMTTKDSTTVALNDTAPAYLLYASQVRDDDYIRGFALFNCSISPIVLKAWMQCGPSPTSTSCEAIRYQRIGDESKANQVLNQLIAFSTRQNVMAYWRTSGLAIDRYSISPTDSYLQGNPNPSAEQSYSNWTIVSESDFSRRLTTLFNTYWEATSSPRDHANGKPNDSPDPKAQPGTSPYSTFNTTRGDAIEYSTVYHMNKLWVTLLLIITSILELLAICGLALEFLIRGPDVLGFASSMTRDNVQIPLPPGGTALDGPKRAVMLRDLRVQIADIRPQDDLGCISVREVPDTNRSNRETTGSKLDTVYRPLDKNRLYL